MEMKSTEYFNGNGSILTFAPCLKIKHFNDISQTPSKRPRKYTRETCMESAKSKASPYLWRSCKASFGFYCAARRSGWYDDCVAQMNLDDFTGISKEDCLREAVSYPSESKWRKTSPRSYRAAQENLWLKECLKAMKKVEKPVIWSDDALRAYANGFETYKAMKAAPRSRFPIAKMRDRSIRADCCSHMPDFKETRAKALTKEKCLEIVKLCKNKTEFKTCYWFEFCQAELNGWLEECLSTFYTSASLSRLQMQKSSDTFYESCQTSNAHSL